MPLVLMHAHVVAVLHAVERLNGDLGLAQQLPQVPGRDLGDVLVGDPLGEVHPPNTTGLVITGMAGSSQAAIVPVAVSAVSVICALVGRE
jgi:hypothetical protein